MRLLRKQKRNEIHETSKNINFDDLIAIIGYSSKLLFLSTNILNSPFPQNKYQPDKYLMECSSKFYSVLQWDTKAIFNNMS